MGRGKHSPLWSDRSRPKEGNPPATWSSRSRAGGTQREREQDVTFLRVWATRDGVVAGKPQRFRGALRSALPLR